VILTMLPRDHGWLTAKPMVMYYVRTSDRATHTGPEARTFFVGLGSVGRIVPGMNMSSQDGTASSIRRSMISYCALRPGESVSACAATRALAAAWISS
jgi:hypothetical protein